MERAEERQMGRAEKRQRQMGRAEERQRQMERAEERQWRELWRDRDTLHTSYFIVFYNMACLYNMYTVAYRADDQ
jgi:hypothetical protein